MKIFKRTLAVLLLLTLLILPGACSSQTGVQQTFTGYITSEDDFAANLGEDTAFMVYMKPMAQSGLGITFQEDGKWVFYYFDGKISTGDSKDSNGDWMFDGTGSQLKAWNIVGDQIAAGNTMDPVPVTVTGALNGNTATNPGPDKDGKIFKVITVSEITPYTSAEITASSNPQTDPQASPDVSYTIGTYAKTSAAPASPSNDAGASPSAEASADAVILERVAITAPAAKLTYNVGDVLDLTGLKLSGTYSDGSTVPLPITAANVTGFDSAVPRDKTKLTITYEGKTTSFTVAIVQPAVEVTFTGYITSEDDFAAGLGEDTAAMVYMRLMALSGLGITFEEDGKWVFYYFDGTFSTDNTKDENGNWVFDGTGTQKKAWDIVGEQMADGDKMDPVPVTVTGILAGYEATNPGPDRDGLYFPVITVTQISRD